MTYKLIDYEDLNAFSEKLKTKYATKNELPKNLSDLQEDTSHRLVTDTEKGNWNNKVDKKEGYGLSKNDYDDTAKEKLNSSINKIVFKAIVKQPKAILRCTDNTGNTVNVDLPVAHGYDAGLMSSSDKAKLDSIDNGANKTTKLSQLENDTDFKTESEIQQMIEKASSLKKEVVTSLPTTGKDDVIYLVKDSKGKDNNNYLEYLCLNGKYELIGSTQVDLSGYVTSSDLTEYATSKDLNNSISSAFTQLAGQIDTITKSTQNILDKNNDKAIAGDNGTNIMDNQTYTTPEYVNWLINLFITERFETVNEVLETLSDKKLDETDIQEFTQQELEEAFK